MIWRSMNLMKRTITCIICPKGCEIEADNDSGTLVLSGYDCARGKRYAETEMTCPMRTLTTTVRLPTGRMLPVRTDAPVPKAKLFDCMAEVAKIRLPVKPVAAGEVILADICGTGANLIASAAWELNANP